MNLIKMLAINTLMFSSMCLAQSVNPGYFHPTKPSQGPNSVPTVTSILPAQGTITAYGTPINFVVSNAQIGSIITSAEGQQVITTSPLTTQQVVVGLGSLVCYSQTVSNVVGSSIYTGSYAPLTLVSQSVINNLQNSLITVIANNDQPLIELFTSQLEAAQAAASKSGVMACSGLLQAPITDPLPSVSPSLTDSPPTMAQVFIEVGARSVDGKIPTLMRWSYFITH